MEIIHKYFEGLSERQVAQIGALKDLYTDWNTKINVISRKDIDNLYERHILHSMSLALVTDFKDGAQILDLGTGGGMPGIPLAILFPNVHFTLIDGTRKKISVVQAVAEALELDNVTAQQHRVEEWKGQKFDFVVTRAVATLSKLIPWTLPVLKKKHQHGYPNGLFALKGGNVQQEIDDLPNEEYIELFALSDLFEEAFFQEKLLVYVQG
ncbi:MAG: 16S rRNA (guanine(527)-N(7))-methyltransferase RsmG [Bacteroidota bacterium]